MKLGKIVARDIAGAHGVQAKHKYVINISVGTRLKEKKVSFRHQQTGGRRRRSGEGEKEEIPEQGFVFRGSN